MADIDATAAFFGARPSASTEQPAPAAATPAASPAPAIDETAAFFGAKPSAPAAPAATTSSTAAPSGVDETAAFFGAGSSAATSADHVFDRGIISQESGGQQFDKNGKPLTSTKGAIGVAQVMPATGPEAARLAGLPWDDLRYRTDAEYNKALGRAYYAKQFQDFGDHALAAAAYNAGPTALRAAVEKATQLGRPGDWLQFLPAETRAYVPSVLHRAGAAPGTQTATASPQRGYPSPFATGPAGDRTWGAAAADTALGAASGLAGLVKTGGELAGLASGDMNNVVSRVSDAVQTYLQSQQSEQLQGKRAVRDQSIKEADGVLEKAWTAFAQTVSDPALLADVVASNAATMIPAAAAGRAAAAYSGGRAMLAAMEAGPVSIAARQAIARSAGEVGVWSAKGAAAVQQGADVAQQAYDDALEKPEAVWQKNPDYARRVSAGENPVQVKHDLALSSARATFTPALAISIAANSLPGTEGIERALVGGVAKETVKAGTKMAIPKAMAKTALGESTSELLEEGGGQFAANVANQAYVDPNQDLGHNVGEQGGLGAAGGFGQGAVAGVAHRAPPQVAAKAAEPSSPLSRAAQAGVESPAGQQQAAAAQQQQAQQAAQGDTASRLSQLEQIATGGDGKPGRLFTPEEAKEYAGLKSAKDATPGQKQEDPLADRVSAVAQRMRADGTMNRFRAEDSDFKPAKLVADLALAQSPSAPPGAREQALGRLEFALEWAGAPEAVAPQGAPAQVSEDGARALKLVSDLEAGKPVHPVQLREAATKLGVPWDRNTTDFALAQRIRAAAQKGAPSKVAQAPAAPPATVHTTTEGQAAAEAAATRAAQLEQEEGQGEPPLSQSVDKAERERTAQAATAANEQAAARVEQVQHEESAQPNAGTSVPNLGVWHSKDADYPVEIVGRPEMREGVAYQRVRFQGRETYVPEAELERKNPANPEDNAGSVQPVQREQVQAPKAGTPAGPGSAVHRKRRATLSQLVGMGLNLVERRGDKFFLTDGRREFALEGAADAQLARREISAHLDAKTGRATGHTASNAQVAADNYRKGEPVTLHPGVTFIAEHGAGTERFDRKNNPPRWRQVLKHAYGDIAGTVGADGDKVDAFIVGNGNRIFVIDQVDPKTGRFDEHKVMLRARDEQSAREAYLANYEPGWQGLGAITEMTPEQLRAWVENKAATKRAVGKINERSARSDQNSVPAGRVAEKRGEPAGGVAAGGVRGGSTDAWARDRIASLFGGRSVPAGLVVADGGRIYVNVGDKRIELVDRPDVGADVKSSEERGGQQRPVAASTAGLIDLVANRMGQQPVWFRADGFGDGFTLSKVLPDVVFLNEKTSIDPVAVFGHEFWHNLKAIDPALHKVVSDIVRARIKEGGSKAFREYYKTPLSKQTGDQKLTERELEEFVSDLGGNFMAEPAFWSEVMEQIQREHPEQATTLLAKLQAFLERMIQNLLEAVRGNTFATEHLVSDLETIRVAFRDAMAKHLAATGVRQSTLRAQVLREKQAAKSPERSAPKDNAAREQRDSPADQNDPAGGLGRDAGSHAQGVPEYGTPRAGAISLTGTHFSTEPRTELSSAYYGRGHKGAERERVAGDKLLSQRVHFYVDHGQGIQPEQGVGSHAHQVQLRNIYDPKTGEISTEGSHSDFERRVAQAGFDGYYASKFTNRNGAVVLIGKHNVPVKYIGTPEGFKAEPPKAPTTVKKALVQREIDSLDVARIPGAKLSAGTLTVPVESRQAANEELKRIGSTMRLSPARLADSPSSEVEAVRKKYEGTSEWMKAPNGQRSNLSPMQWVHVRTPAFKSWFGDWEEFARKHGEGGVWHDDKKAVSKVVDDNGEPLVVYHGSDKSGFMRFNKPGGTGRGDLGIFTTDKFETAASYVTSGRIGMVTKLEAPKIHEVEGKFVFEAPDGYESEPFDTREEALQSAERQDAGERAPGVYSLFMNLRDPQEENFEGSHWNGERYDGKFNVILPTEDEPYTDDKGERNFEEEHAQRLAEELDGDIVPARGMDFSTDDAVRNSRKFNDGVIIHDVVDDGPGHSGSGAPSKVYIAFEPNQVKSADFNAGSYSVSSDDIRHSTQRAPRQKLRPEVVKAASPVLRFLTPTERAKLRVDTATRMHELFRDMPSANEMAAIAHAGRAKRGWYAESSKALVHVFGADAPRFAALLAAMSPQTSVETNLRNALNTWKNWTRAGRPQAKGEIFQIMGRSVEGNNLTDSVLPAWVPNSVRALTAEDPQAVVISGPKVNSFMLNLRGVASEVTNDAWMANYAAVDQQIFGGSLNVAGTDPGKGPGYLAMSARVRAAAARLKELTGEEWTPAEVQETIWSWAKTLYELQDKDMGARELLDNGSVTNDLIRSTPDFRTQLHEERNEETLRQAGYNEQLDSLRGRIDHAGPGEQGSEAGRQAGPFDSDTQGNHERRAASRLEQLRDSRLAAEREKAAVAQQSPARDGGRGDEGGGIAPLEGAPAVAGASGPDTRLLEVAQRYAAERGITLRRQAQYVQADPEFAARIAAAYQEMPHAPNDPKVRAAYRDMVRQVREQYDALERAGYVFTFFDDKTDPYQGNPWNSMRDLRANRHMAVYGTYSGYGTEGLTGAQIESNPMLSDTGLRWPDQNGAEHPVTANDLFRAVHDAFGHGLEGAGFRADGEENAWQAHARLFTGSALGALTTETRGQNSWLNFGPYGERNRTAKLQDTVFAEQKTGLMPQWTWTAGRVADEVQMSPQRVEPQDARAMADLRRRVKVLEKLQECLA